MGTHRRSPLLARRAVLVADLRSNRATRCSSGSTRDRARQVGRVAPRPDRTPTPGRARASSSASATWAGCRPSRARTAASRSAGRAGRRQQPGQQLRVAPSPGQAPGVSPTPRVQTSQRVTARQLGPCSWTASRSGVGDEGRARSQAARHRAAAEQGELVVVRRGAARRAGGHHQGPGQTGHDGDRAEAAAGPPRRRAPRVAQRARGRADGPPRTGSDGRLGRVASRTENRCRA